MIAVTVGVTVTYTLANVLGNSVSLGDSSDSGSLGNIIQYLLVGLLVFLSIKNYVRRETIEPPRWLGAMQNARPRTAFMAGLLLLSVFPSDFVVLMTVGMNLAQNNASLLGALPFVVATILIAALPVLSYLLFRRRAVAGHAQGARLDEHPQLAGEHHRLHHIHPADPRLTSRSGGENSDDVGRDPRRNYLVTRPRDSARKTLPSRNMPPRAALVWKGSWDGSATRRCATATGSRC